MAWPDTIGRRPSRLSRERIVAAALRIIDRDGLPSLNMRRIGTELDVGAMAVYRYFPNKAAILDAIVEAALCDLAEAASEREWRAAFRVTFLSLRTALARHPNALPLVASRPLASPQLKRRLESTRDVLLGAGFGENDALRLVHAGISLTVGYLWLETGGFVGELPDDAPFLRTRAAAARQEPDDTLAQASTWSREEDFAAGLELLIAESSVNGD
jgi:TetR/AcrR family tetracycline transcriptional repressor